MSPVFFVDIDMNFIDFNINVNGKIMRLSHYSGNPIIRDDHIIGAVTHVMINDPQKGYGVYIENMLS